MITLTLWNPWGILPMCQNTTMLVYAAWIKLLGCPHLWNSSICPVLSWFVSWISTTLEAFQLERLLTNGCYVKQPHLEPGRNQHTHSSQPCLQTCHNLPQLGQNRADVSITSVLAQLRHVYWEGTRTPQNQISAGKQGGFFIHGNRSMSDKRKWDFINILR